MIKVRITGSMNDFGHDVVFYDEKDTRLYIANVNEIGKIIWTEHKTGELLKSPTYTLNREMAQVLVDAYYKMGIVPKDKPPLENELTAVRDHLKDMRDLVFKSGKL